MMNENETRALLAYVQAADNRNVGQADIAFWMETMPGWLDLETAKAAVRMFFTEPERNAGESTYFTTRHLIRCAKAVRRQRETEEARARAQRPAIGARYAPPEEGWRARVPGGYPDGAEGPAEGPLTDAELREMSPEQMAENRARLQGMLNTGAAQRDAL